MPDAPPAADPPQMLTPTQFCVLARLHMENRPLKVSGDLKKRYGLSLSKLHAAKLAEDGLVRVSEGPLTVELTEAGADVLQAAARGEGWGVKGDKMGLATVLDLYAHAIRGAEAGAEKAPVKADAEREKSADAEEEADPAPEATAEPLVGNPEAQRHLGASLQALATLRESLREAGAEGASGALRKQWLRVEKLGMSLSAAAAELGMQTDAEPGDIVPFSADKYTSRTPLALNASARVKTPAIMGRLESGLVTVAKGKAEPA